jgi:neuropeptide Y receptor
MNISVMNFTGTLLDYKTESYKTDHLISAPWVIPLVLLILSSITSNLVVIIAWARHPQLHTAPNLHIVSLAAADCLVTVVSMPITVIRMTGNQK